MNFKEEANKLLKEEEKSAPKLEDSNSLVVEKNATPAGYVAVPLSSNGLLSLPKVLHVRNFNTTEIIELVSQLEENRLGALVRMFNKTILEDVDISQATDKELTEIALTLFNNFYGNILVDYSFPLNEDDIKFLYENNKELLDSIRNREYYPSVDIPIQSITINSIPENFKEPITITDKLTKETFGFKIPRIADALVVQEYVTAKYEKEDEDMYKIEKAILEENQLKIESKISAKDRKSYAEYEKKRAIDHIIVLQKLCLVTHNGKVIENLDDKLDLSIPQNVWITFSNHLEKIKLGVQEEVKVMSPITNKEETRRFEFRPYDIIQTVSKLDSSDRYDIQYG